MLLTSRQLVPFININLPLNNFLNLTQHHA